MKIVILDGYTTNPGDNPWDPVRALGEVTIYERTEDDQVPSRAAEAEIVVTNKNLFTPQVMDELKHLKCICVLATGVNNVDLRAAAARGIVVCNVPAYSTASVAQFTFALLLELCHRVGRHDEQVHHGKWASGPDFCFWETPQVELAGKNLGIVGFGRIGKRVAAIGHALGMPVIAATRRPQAPPGFEPFAWAAVEELFERADVVSLHCPLTEENAGFVNRRMLERMKPTAFLVNTARGGLVNEQDLADVLNRDIIAGAAVDVVSHEPILPDNPLLQAKNCLITPHIAWAALAARKRLLQITADNIKAFLAAHPVNVVN